MTLAHAYNIEVYQIMIGCVSKAAATVTGVRTITNFSYSFLQQKQKLLLLLISPTLFETPVHLDVL